MKTKLMVVVSVMALLLCGATMIAYAQGPGGPGGTGPRLGRTRAAWDWLCMS